MFWYQQILENNLICHPVVERSENDLSVDPDLVLVKPSPGEGGDGCCGIAGISRDYCDLRDLDDDLRRAKGDDDDRDLGGTAEEGNGEEETQDRRPAARGRGGQDDTPQVSDWWNDR